MGVNFHNIWALIVGALLIAAVLFIALRLRDKPDKDESLKAANTARLKALPLYRRRLIEARILRFLTYAGVIAALAAAVLLTARPYKREPIKDTVSRRDIFMCIDLSSSNYEGVKEMVQAFRETVSGLKGDRIGISLFNTSSVQYVPMTEDYDFALQRLDALEEYLSAQEAFMTEFAQKYDSVYDIPQSERSRYEELNKILASFDAGITAGYELKGTSAIGEGLASCLFSFPELAAEERTRIILFVTDNKPELLSAPLVTLKEAAEMCQYNKVVVFGIDPAIGQNIEESSANINEMKEAVEYTGGKFYGPGTALTAQDILADIQSSEVMSTKTTTSTMDTDIPQIFFYVLAAGFVVLFITTIYLIFRRGLSRGKLSRKLTAVIMLLVMGAGVVGVGLRPMYLSPSAEIKTSNLDVAFVVDTTISMWAEDHGAGTRIEGVKNDLQTIMNSLPGSCFCLIRFDDGADIMTPFTQDINAISDILDQLSMPSYATAQGSSLNTAHDAIGAMMESSAKKKGHRKTVVFLFSDGETTDGSSLMSFRDLNDLVDNGAVLGYGTTQGGRMNYPGRGYIKNVSDGSVALSRIDEANLHQISNDLGIPYINETRDMGASLLTRLHAIRLMSRDTAFANGDRTGYAETYHYFSAFVGLLLLAWLFLTIYRGGVA